MYLILALSLILSAAVCDSLTETKKSDEAGDTLVVYFLRTGEQYDLYQSTGMVRRLAYNHVGTFADYGMI